RSTVEVGPSTCAPDGDTVYFLGTERLDLAGRTQGLFSVPFDGSAEPTRLTDAEGWDLHDTHAAARLVAGKDGVLAVASRRGAVDVVRVPYDGGEPEWITSGRHMVTGFDAAAGTLVGVVTSEVSSGEVAVLDGGTPRVISDFGSDFGRSVALRPM